jgi:hypothetical protein
MQRGDLSKLRNQQAQMGLNPDVAPYGIHKVCRSLVADMQREYGMEWASDEVYLEMAYRLCALELRRGGIAVSLRFDESFLLFAGHRHITLDSDRAHLRVSPKHPGREAGRVIITGEGAFTMWAKVKGLDERTPVLRNRIQPERPIRFSQS